MEWLRGKFQRQKSFRVTKISNKDTSVSAQILASLRAMECNYSIVSTVWRERGGKSENIVSDILWYELIMRNLSAKRESGLAGLQMIPDITLPKVNVIIETKMVLDQTALRDLNYKIPRYYQKTSCTMYVVFYYDAYYADLLDEFLGLMVPYGDRVLVVYWNDKAKDYNLVEVR